MSMLVCRVVCREGLFFCFYKFYQTPERHQSGEYQHAKHHRQKYRRERQPYTGKVKRGNNHPRQKTSRYGAGQNRKNAQKIGFHGRRKVNVGSFGLWRLHGFALVKIVRVMLLRASQCSVPASVLLWLRPNLCVRRNRPPDLYRFYPLQNTATADAKNKILTPPRSASSQMNR